MKKVAVIAPEKLPVPPIKGGARELFIYETAKRMRRYKPYVFCRADENLPLSEFRNGIHYRRIKTSVNLQSVVMEKIVYLYTLFLRVLEKTTIKLHIEWVYCRAPCSYLQSYLYSYFLYLQYLKPMLKELVEIQPDIVHVHNRPWYIPFIRRSLDSKTKIILHMANLFLSDIQSSRYRRQIIDSVDCIVGNSSFINKEIISKTPKAKEKCIVIYNGVDLQKFKPFWRQLEKRRKIRSQYGIKNDAPVIGFVGRLEPYKGIENLLLAMQELVQFIPNAILLVVGSSWYGSNKKTVFVKRLEELAEKISKNVIFTGFIPPIKIPDIYSIMDIFVSPVLWDEPFGFVFIEAQATGLPIISSKRGGIPETVEENITAILLENPSNISYLIKKLKYLLGNRLIRRRMGEKGRELIVQKFSWDKISKEVEELYTRILTDS